jgi:hypothetical protein
LKSVIGSGILKLHSVSIPLTVLHDWFVVKPSVKSGASSTGARRLVAAGGPTKMGEWPVAAQRGDEVMDAKSVRSDVPIPRLMRTGMSGASST